MPRKPKRYKKDTANLVRARAKRLRDASTSNEQEANEMDCNAAGTMQELLDLSCEALNTDDETLDPSFDLNSSVKSDTQHQIETFCEEWVTQLSRDDRYALGVFLQYHLRETVGKSETEAAELAGLMIGRSDRTVRDWKTQFYENNGNIPESKQGKYQRSGVLWQNEALNDKVCKYVRENAFVKGSANLTSMSFCQWVNEHLLANETLEPGCPRSISVETARHWLHELGFEVISAKKGCFVDGHERADVVESRNKFIRRMVALGFLNESNAPTEAAKQSLPADLQCPTQEVLDKTVIFFHDESTFQANEDQSTFWGVKGAVVMKPKNKGSGIMVSDFIDEKNGYLCLTQEEYVRARQSDPSIQMEARSLFEYGEAKEGYWTCDKFIVQMKKAIKIAEFKYPKSDGWRHVWIFDHSSCHAAMAEDSLDVSKMNVNPGGKQRVMRNGYWNGKVFKMNFAIGVPKGLRIVLQERGVDTTNMNADQMREVLKQHPDFRDEKCRIERLLVEEHSHLAYFLPKYHCELNPIERVWAQAKRYSKAYCKYSIVSLKKKRGPSFGICFTRQHSKALQKSSALYVRLFRRIIWRFRT